MSKGSGGSKTSTWRKPSETTAPTMGGGWDTQSVADLINETVFDQYGNRINITDAIHQLDLWDIIHDEMDEEQIQTIIKTIQFSGFHSMDQPTDFFEDQYRLALSSKEMDSRLLSSEIATNEDYAITFAYDAWKMPSWLKSAIGDIKPKDGVYHFSSFDIPSNQYGDIEYESGGKTIVKSKMPKDGLLWAVPSSPADNFGNFYIHKDWEGDYMEYTGSRKYKKGKKQ